MATAYSRTSPPPKRPPCSRKYIRDSVIIKTHFLYLLLAVSPSFGSLSSIRLPHHSILHPSTRPLRRHLVALLLPSPKPLLLRRDNPSFETKVKGASTKNGHEGQGGGTATAERCVSEVVGILPRIATERTCLKMLESGIWVAECCGRMEKRKIPFVPCGAEPGRGGNPGGVIAAIFETGSRSRDPLVGRMDDLSPHCLVSQEPIAAQASSVELSLPLKYRRQKCYLQPCPSLSSSWVPLQCLPLRTDRSARPTSPSRSRYVIAGLGRVRKIA